MGTGGRHLPTGSRWRRRSRRPCLPGAASLKSVDPKKRNSDQRWAALYYDTYSLGSAAAHDDPVTTDFVWSRADAEAMLAMTAALLNHYLATE